jgi:hypothetical protein
MAHSCPSCGQACYCDGEDTWIEDVQEDIPDECAHECQPEPDDDDGLDPEER